MNILFVSSEVVPFIKTGGLADVASALPKALKQKGVDIRVMLPKYGDIPEQYKNDMEPVATCTVPVGWRQQYCGIERLDYDGVTYYFIDNEYYFKREGIYGFYDDGERFAYFDRAVLEAIGHIDFMPDVIHCNDWHSGMISPLLKAHYQHDYRYRRLKTVFTIHNLRYQGIFSPEILGELLSLSEDYNHVDALEFYGGVSFMKGGINYSDVITTVSQTYAQEIQYEFFGERLDGLLRRKQEKLHGIVNGIDVEAYDPKHDDLIFKQYDGDCLEVKQENKIKLQEQLGLPKRADVPMIGMVTRLAPMKGLDLLLAVLDDIMGKDVQLVILGTGDKKLEATLRDYADRYPNKLSVNIFFDNDLAHKIYAGADLFLMPSLFEPCGLGQMIAMRYGTLPIVRETGGLKDTVSPYNDYRGTGNGFSFTNINAHDMLYTIERALNFYRDKTTWATIVKSAISGDYSWAVSAEAYYKLYQQLMANS